MNGSFSDVLLVLAIALPVAVWMVFGSVAGFTALALVLAMLAFNVRSAR